ncbi:U-box domain-containing protein 35-like isoform X2 [Apium graveolens]|uniref:U-box domain-containing protein 35-like isoform X2 n=1 Tax=Apium graveolens TaxID=4045 RepID=UPI003D7AAD3F
MSSMHRGGVGNNNNIDMVAVAIDKDRGSQHALKWAVDNLLGKGKNVTLLHVKQKPPSTSGPNLDAVKSPADKEFFLPFRCFCTRKDIKVSEMLVEDTDVAKGICEFLSANLIQNLVLGSPSRGLVSSKFKAPDVASSVSRGAPEFCNVYIISKGKISSLRSATSSPATDQRFPFPPRHSSEDLEIKSPFTRGNISNKSYGDLPDCDISFVSSGRSSTDRMSDDFGSRLSCGSDTENRLSFGSAFNSSEGHNSSSLTFNSQESSSSSHNMDDVEAEMRRLKLELKQTMDMYSSACKEALSAKQKAMELHRWKMEEEARLEEARLAEEAALAIAEQEKAKCKAAIEAAEAAQRIAKMEAQKRISAEMKALKEAEEKKKYMSTLAHNDTRYRKYSIEEIESATEFFNQSRKIGEGGYGPVYKCYLDHTPVAVKVLRPDAAQGRSQFQQEVEVLSCIRHPNMVLLLGACPEYGCLVYEYMANGSLEDRLFRQGNTPVLSWQQRFRIAAEIGTGLLFLHQSKPEPLVHRDLKPGNILLDRNYVSKISDVGLARLVPPSVADTVTQYRMTSTAGTFCYIDPEYQQTGMLGIKSDIYSLGIMLLQIITARPPMGLTHHIERALERGTIGEILDPEVTDWPIEEAERFARMSLRCAELRRKDRPDLGNDVLPELERLRQFAEESLPNHDMIYNMGMGGGRSSSNSSISNSSTSNPTQDRISTE